MLFSSARSSIRLLFSLGMKQPCPDSVSEALRNKQRVEQTRKNLYGKSRIHRAVNTNTEIAQPEGQHAAQSAVDEPGGGKTGEPGKIRCENKCTYRDKSAQQLCRKEAILERVTRKI